MLPTILFLLFLGIVFIGMGATILPAVQGDPSQQAARGDFRDGFFTTAPILCSMGLVVLLGIYIPLPVESLLREATAFLEVKR